MRSPASLAGQIESEESIGGGGIGHQGEAGVGRDPLGPVRAADVLQDGEPLAQSQVERGVGITGEAPHGAAQARPIRV
jgi:hypothetical protein